MGGQAGRRRRTARAVSQGLPHQPFPPSLGPLSERAPRVADRSVPGRRGPPAFGFCVRRSSGHHERRRRRRAPCIASMYASVVACWTSCPYIAAIALWSASAAEVPVCWIAATSPLSFASNGVVVRRRVAARSTWCFCARRAMSVVTNAIPTSPAHVARQVHDARDRVVLLGRDARVDERVDRHEEERHPHRLVHAQRHRRLEVDALVEVRRHVEERRRQHGEPEGDEVPRVDPRRRASPRAAAAG